MGRSPAHLIWDRSGKVTLLDRGVAPLIIGCTGRKLRNHSRLCRVTIARWQNDVTFTKPRTCSSSRYESRAPERVYSAGLSCQDCGTRRSNDARGQRATVVYARVAHGPSGGARSRRPRHHPNCPATNLPGLHRTILATYHS